MAVADWKSTGGQGKTDIMTCDMTCGSSHRAGSPKEDRGRHGEDMEHDI